MAIIIGKIDYLFFKLLSRLISKMRIFCPIFKLTAILIFLQKKIIKFLMVRELLPKAISFLEALDTAILSI